MQGKHPLLGVEMENDGMEAQSPSLPVIECL